MRPKVCALAVLLALGGTASVEAQANLGSFSARQVTFQPIDTSRVIAPPPTAAFNLPTQRTTFRLTDLLTMLRLPSFQRVRGESNLPSPSSFPTYKNFEAVPFKPMPFQSITGYQPNYVPTNNR